MENKENMGNIKISDEVIAIISGIATSEIDGVYAMGGSAITSGIAEILGTKKNASASKGIKAEVKEGKVIVDIHVIVKYGIKIPEVAWKIQERVKEELENMTGLDVERVNVHIDGVNIPKDEEIAEEIIPQTEE